MFEVENRPRPSLRSCNLIPTLRGFNRERNRNSTSHTLHHPNSRHILESYRQTARAIQNTPKQPETPTLDFKKSPKPPEHQRKKHQINLIFTSLPHPLAHAVAATTSHRTSSTRTSSLAHMRIGSTHLLSQCRRTDVPPFCSTDDSLQHLFSRRHLTIRYRLGPSSAVGNGGKSGCSVESGSGAVS